MQESSVGIQLAIGIFGWTVYFLVIFFVCNIIYHRLLGKSPGKPNEPIDLHGKTITVLTAWKEKGRRLRRWLIGIGVTLVLLPFLLPAILKIVYS